MAPPMADRGLLRHGGLERVNFRLISPASAFEFDR
jgi:hypothetical protein